MLEREYDRLPKKEEVEKRTKELNKNVDELRQEIGQRKLEAKNLKEELAMRKRQIDLEMKELESEVRANKMASRAKERVIGVPRLIGISRLLNITSIMGSGFSLYIVHIKNYWCQLCQAWAIIQGRNKGVLNNSLRVSDKGTNKGNREVVVRFLIFCNG